MAHTHFFLFYLSRKFIYLIYAIINVKAVVVLLNVSLCNQKAETKIHSTVQLRFISRPRQIIC